MKCNHCKGEIPNGTKYCGFCQAGQDEVINASPKCTSGWQVDDCGSCHNTSCGGSGNTDGSLTAVGKSTKYAVFIVSVVVILIACALVVKAFL